MALLAVLLAGCPNPNISSKGSSLTVSINNHSNASFTTTTTGIAVTENSLAFGSWTIVTAVMMEFRVPPVTTQ